MNILLLHSAEPEILARVRKWEKNSHGMGNFYHLSLVDLENEIVAESRAIKRHIKRAKDLYAIETIIYLTTGTSLPEGYEFSEVIKI